MSWLSAANLSRCPHLSQHNRIAKFPPSDVVKHARRCRPIMDASVLHLIREYIQLKTETGTEIEKRVYTGMTEAQFIERVITKRPLVFYTRSV
jgi:hypothetical protein